MAADPGRAGTRQALMREVNNRIVDVLPQPRLTQTLEILCECVQDACTEWLSLTQDDYTNVRDRSRWFVVRPDHVVPEVERVVRKGDQFVVVEKFGEAGMVAANADESSSAD